MDLESVILVLFRRSGPAKAGIVPDHAELAAFARRSGDTWFLAILNGPSAKTLQVPLSFLRRDELMALMIRDDRGDPASVRIDFARPGWFESLTSELRSGGGFIARFSRN